MLSHWSLRESKSPQVSRTLLSIQVNLNNAVVSMAYTCPLYYYHHGKFLSRVSTGDFSLKSERYQVSFGLKDLKKKILLIWTVLLSGWSLFFLWPLIPEFSFLGFWGQFQGCQIHLILLFHFMRDFGFLVYDQKSLILHLCSTAFSVLWQKTSISPFFFSLCGLLALQNHLDYEFLFY